MSPATSIAARYSLLSIPRRTTTANCSSRSTVEKMRFAVARRRCSSSTAACWLLTVVLLPVGGRVASRLGAGLLLGSGAGVRSLALSGFEGPGASADGAVTEDTLCRRSVLSAFGAGQPPRLTFSCLRISNWLGSQLV